MKNILIILTLLLTYYSVKAQAPIEPLYQNTNYGRTHGAYYKDMDNDFNAYEGTWVYTNGNTTLKIVLQKKEMVSFTKPIGKQYYADCLVGEYQYIENGVEKVNTLSNLNINHNSMTLYNLRDTGIIKKGVPPRCDECPENERRVAMMFTEPTRRNIAGLQ